MLYNNINNSVVLQIKYNIGTYKNKENKMMIFFE